MDLPLIVVSAPVGYGKTTLLVDWLEHDDRTVAWVSLDRADDDVATLMTSIVTGVRRVRALDDAISRELISPDVAVLGRVVPGLAASIGTVDEPLVIVLDHFDEIRSRDCHDALGLLLDLLPDHVQLVVEPPGRVAHRRPTPSARRGVRDRCDRPRLRRLRGGRTSRAPRGGTVAGTG